MEKISKFGKILPFLRARQSGREHSGKQGVQRRSSTDTESLGVVSVKHGVLMMFFTSPTTSYWRFRRRRKKKQSAS